MRYRNVRNGISLYALHVTNVLFPLLTLPILTRALGASEYGKVIFSQSIMMVAMAIVNYSFDYTATREVASNKGDNIAISKLYWKYMGAKLILLGGMTPVVFIVLLVSDRESSLLILAYYPMLIGAVLFPIWYFQGIEEMTKIAAPHILSKGIIFFIIYVSIEEPSDFVTAGFYLGSIYFVSGVIASVQISLSSKVKWMRPSLKVCIKEIRSSYQTFVGLIADSLSSNIGMIVFGVQSVEQNMGGYAAGAKLKNAFGLVTQPISQILYPKISRSYLKEGVLPKNFWLIMLAQLLILLMSLIVILENSELITNLLFKGIDPTVEKIIELMAVSGFFHIIKMTFMTQVLSATGQDGAFKSVAIAQLVMFCTVLLSLTLTESVSGYNIAYSYIAIDIFFILFLLLKAIKGGLFQ